MRIDAAKTLFSGMMSLILSAVTVVMASPFFLGMRYSLGCVAYWILVGTVTSALVAAQWLPLAVVYALQAILIGLYIEWNKRGNRTRMRSAVLSLLITVGVVAFSLFLYVRKLGSQWWPIIQRKGQEFIESSPLIVQNQNLDFNVEQLLMQLPSGVLVLMVLSLFFAILFEERVRGWLQLKEKPQAQEPLTDFRVPDAFIWLFIVAVLASFIETELTWLQVVGANVLNVLMLLYFFQGLAVAVWAMEYFKVGSFWRILLLMVLIIQLFLLLCLLGLADFWIDFRDRLTRKKGIVGLGKKNH